MSAPPQLHAGEPATTESAADFDRLARRFDARGITLEWLPSGELVAHQGSWCRVLADPAAAHRFARLLGV